MTDHQHPNLEGRIERIDDQIRRLFELLGGEYAAGDIPKRLDSLEENVQGIPTMRINSVRHELAMNRRAISILAVAVFINTVTVAGTFVMIVAHAMGM